MLYIFAYKPLLIFIPPQKKNWNVDIILKPKSLLFTREFELTLCTNEASLRIDKKDLEKIQK